MTATFRGPLGLAAERSKHASILVFASAASAIVPPALLLAIGVIPPFWAYLLFLAISRYLYVLHLESKAAASRAEFGANAEDQVALSLEELTTKGWIVERNVLLDGFGDIDLLIRSPHGVPIAIDVKSHSGEISLRETKLVRDDKPMEKDVLKSIKGQAKHIYEKRRDGFVNPVIVFTRAKLSLPSEFIEGVHVINADRLVPLLLTLAQKAVRKRRMFSVDTESGINNICDRKLPQDISKEDVYLIRIQRMAHQFELSNYPDYKVRIHICCKCSGDMLLFNWQGHKLFGVQPPPEPRPHSLQFAFSESRQHSYWMNTCQHCTAAQEDNIAFDTPRLDEWVYCRF